jgi:hypothetical protein
MKTPILLGTLSLVLASAAPEERPPTPPIEAALADLVVAPAIEVAAAPRPPPIQAIPRAAPSDVVVDARAAGDASWSLRVRRDGHLVVLRRPGKRAAGAKEASMVVGRDDPGPLVWETTSLDSLATTRGLVELDREGARLALADAPVPLGREIRPLHRCDSYEDGLGGFTVLCRVERVVEAENVASADPAEGVVVIPGRTTVVRLDLPATPGAADARVIGYADGRMGHVIRAEASLLPGEAKPSLAVFSSERIQPVIPFKPRRIYCGFCDL